MEFRAVRLLIGKSVLGIHHFVTAFFTAIAYFCTAITYQRQKIRLMKKSLLTCVFLLLSGLSLPTAAQRIKGSDTVLPLTQALSEMFMDAGETQVMANAALFLTVNSAAYIPLAFVNIVRFLIQGLGFTRQAVFAGVLEMIARVFVGVMLVPALGYTAVCLANPAAWISS